MGLEIAEFILKTSEKAVTLALAVVGVWLLYNYYRQLSLHSAAKKAFFKDINTSKHLFLTYNKEKDTFADADGNSLSINDGQDFRCFLEPLNRNNILILKGERGSGKTTILKCLFNACYSDYKYRYKYRNFKNKNIVVYLPVYINKFYLHAVENPISNYLTSICDPILWFAKIVAKNDLVNYQQHRKNFFESLNLNRKCSLFQYKILLCIDGFNELSIETQGYLEEELQNLGRLEDVKVIVTTRYMTRLIDNAVTFCAGMLQPENVKKYLSDQGVEETNTNDFKYITSPLLAVKYFNWRAQKADSHLDDMDTHLGTLARIESSVDIFWNAYCTELKKMISLDDSQEKRLMYYILLRYYLPYIADQLENNLSDKFKKDAFSKDWFYKSFYRFIDNISNYIPMQDTIYSDACNTLKRDYTVAELEQYLQYLQKSVALIEYAGNSNQYKFVNEIDQIFLAAVYLYNRDVYSLYCIDNTNVLKDTTMGKCYRVFYSRIMYNWSLRQNDKNIQNIARWKRIKSDLYYYGDGFQQDVDAALRLSYEVINMGEAGDTVSKNWHKWNIFFIELDRLNVDVSNTDVYSRLFKLLEDTKEDNWQTYYPLYDKVGFIFYNNHIYADFKKSLSNVDFRKTVSKVLSKFDLENVINWEEYLQETTIDKHRKEIQLLFFGKAAEKGKYHFAYNKLGRMCENEGKWKEAFSYYEASYKCDPTDYYVVGKMLQILNDGKCDKKKSAMVLSYAKAVYQHIEKVSPIMDGKKGIQGYPSLLTALGDYYYKRYLSCNKGRDLKKAFNMYYENVNIKDDKEYKFHYDKSRLFVGFLAEKYSNICHVASNFSPINIDEFENRYKTVDALTASILNECKN